MTAATQQQEIIHAYRRLYRSLLQGVSYARPARYIGRDQLRTAFREPDAKLNAEGVKRTVWFFQAAARERGLEHQVLKNLIETRARRSNYGDGWKKVNNESKAWAKFIDERETAFEHYDMTVAMLNKSMGLCLR